MAVDAPLSPWPAATATVSRAAAVARLKPLLNPALDDARVNALGSAASLLVERYAPLAPQSIRDEAVVRTTGWLLEQPSAAVRSHSEGPVSIGYAPTHMSALRHSGSMALLTMWKRRRGGHIG